MYQILIAALLLTVVPSPVVSDGPEAVYQKALDNEDRSDADLARDRTSKPLDVLKTAGIKPGMKVLDLYAGGGYYTEILSHVVGPEGQVYMYNNQAYLNFVKGEVEKRNVGQRLANVVIHTREADNMELPENHFDAAFMIMSYHDLFYSDKNWQMDGDKVMASVVKSLKKGGVLLILDHAAIVGSKAEAAQKLHRIDEEFTKEQVKALGFEFVGSTDVLRNSEDDRTELVFSPKIRRRTDRFVFAFKKN